MSKRKKKQQCVPESGTQKLQSGCRVYIIHLQLTGTVLEFENTRYLVRFQNLKGILESKFFKEAELTEQLILPFDESPF